MIIIKLSNNKKRNIKGKAAKTSNRSGKENTIAIGAKILDSVKQLDFVTLPMVPSAWIHQEEESGDIFRAGARPQP